MKTCIACGMPMKKASDFAMNDESRDYCVHCARPDGSMQSFEEKKESMINFIINNLVLKGRGCCSLKELDSGYIPLLRVLKLARESVQKVCTPRHESRPRGWPRKPPKARPCP